MRRNGLDDEALPEMPCRVLLWQRVPENGLERRAQGGLSVRRGGGQDGRGELEERLGGGG